MLNYNFPKFSKAVQDEKFAELLRLKKIPEKTKEELEHFQKIREELILNNLGLSQFVARRYCEKFHILNSLEDISSECIYALEVAIDSFDEEKGAFSSFYYKSADRHLTKLYHNSSADALTAFNVAPTEYRRAKDGDEVTKDFDLDWVPDKDEDIPETFAKKDLIEQLSKFLDTKVDERRRKIFKMRSGFGYDRKYTYEELSQLFGVSRARIGVLYDETLVNLKAFLQTNFNDYYRQYFDEEPKKRYFSGNQERDEYLYNSYFGLNGYKRKTMFDLSEELEIRVSAISSAIKRQKELASNSSNGLSARCDFAKRNEKIFNSYLGLDGNEPLSISELASLYNLSKEHIKNVIVTYAKNQNHELYEQFKKEKSEEQRRNGTLTHAKLYFKAKGLYGFEKNTTTYLSKEFNYSLRTVSKYVKNFENYFNSLSPSEQNEIIIAVTTSEEQK